MNEHKNHHEDRDLVRRVALHEQIIAERKKELFGLIAQTKSETSVPRKLAAAKQLGRIAVEERSDCFSILYAIEAAYDVIATSGGSRKDTGVAILEITEKYLGDLGLGQKILSEHRSEDERFEELEKIKRAIERSYRSPDVHTRRQSFRSTDNLVLAVLAIGEERKRVGNLGINRLPIGDINVMQAKVLKNGKSVLAQGATKTGEIQEAIFDITRDAYLKTTGESRLSVSQKVIHVLNRNIPLSPNHPSLYEQKLEGVSVKDLEEEKELETFAQKALQLISGPPKGEVFWQAATDALLLSHPIGKPDHKTVLYEGQDTFSIKTHWFQSFLTANIVGPAYGFYTSPFAFDPIFEKVMNNADVQTISHMASIVLTNIANQGSLAWLDYANHKDKDKLDASQRKVSGIMHLPEYALVTDPNNTIRRMREELVPSLERSLAHRFPGQKWTELFLDDIRTKLPDQPVEENFNERMNALLIDSGIFPQSSSTNKAMQAYEFEDFKRIFINNLEFIRPAVQHQLYIVPQQTLQIGPFKEAEIMAVDCKEDGSIYFAITIPGETSILNYRTSGLLSLKSGELEDPENKIMGELKPNVKIALERNIMAFLYDWFVAKDLLKSRSQVLELSREVYKLPHETIEKDAIRQIALEEIAIAIFAENGKITRTCWDQSTIKRHADLSYDAALQYPGGIPALRELALKYVSKESEPVSSEDNLLAMLNYLDKMGVENG